MAALLSLISSQKPFRTLIRDVDNKSDILMIDATLKIETTFEADITDLPVEDGIDVTDHIRRKPIRCSVQGVISESPLTLKNELQGLVTAAGSLAGGLVGGFGPTVGAVGGSVLGAALLGSGDGNNNPAIAARKILEKLVDNRMLFTLVDKYRKYENMAITSLSFPRDQKSGHKLEFNMTCKEIRIITSQETQIKKVSSKVAHGAGKTNKLGSQTGTPNTDAASNGSVLFKGGKFLGLL